MLANLDFKVMGDPASKDGRYWKNVPGDCYVIPHICIHIYICKSAHIYVHTKVFKGKVKKAKCLSGM